MNILSKFTWFLLFLNKYIAENATNGLANFEFRRFLQIKFITI